MSDGNDEGRRDVDEVIEAAKGKVQRAADELNDHDDGLAQQARAQQGKSDSQRESARAEHEAEKSDADPDPGP